MKPIVDGQVHLWAANTAERPWSRESSRHHRAEPMGKDELIQEMDAAGVYRAVLVPPSWDADRNDVVLEAALSQPERLAVMGRISLMREDPEIVARWRTQPGMLGVRLTFARGDQYAWLTDGTADWFWPAAEAAGVPVSVYAPGQLREVAKVAGRYPGLMLVIDHLALPPRVMRDDEIADGLRELFLLSTLENVAVKASGLPSLVAEPYPYPSLHSVLRSVVRMFGSRRTFWGTDLTRLPCTYEQALRFFEVALANLQQDDIDWVLGRGICEWLGWPLEE